jgi:hypothetical protein
MNKSTFFTGQPIFSQLLKLLPSYVVTRAVSKHSSDRYYKKFNTHHHLITMLYASYQNCTSLREITSGIRACEGRLACLGMRHLPTRSAFSDANKKRNYQVFEDIYLSLYQHQEKCLSDSRKDLLNKKLIIIDSTTITLFKEILKGAGIRSLNGKRKGGIKVHMAVGAGQHSPFLVRFSPAADPDVKFFKDLRFPAGSVVVMDRGYNNYEKLNEWTEQKVNWVTRLRARSFVEVTRERQISPSEIKAGVLADKEVLLGADTSRIKAKVRCRLVSYRDKGTGRLFSFLTNNQRWKASKVADIYKRRWQIELLFKRLKQNMPLQYFLGDNENAIKIQIYCALIGDLLLNMATRGIKRRWAFSNLASMIRLHLTNYTNLRRFLEDPDKCRIINPIQQPDIQLKLNLSG